MSQFAIDWLTFLRWAELLKEGQYVSLYPLPFQYLFIPFTYVDWWVGYSFLFVLGLVLLVKELKRDAIIWAVYPPILLNLILGQVDIIFWWLFKNNSALSLALMTLKPHLFLLVLPKLIRRKPNFYLKFGLSLAIIYLPFFLIRPAWPVEWLRNVQNVAVGRIATSVPFWSSVGLLVTFLAILLLTSLWTKRLDGVIMLFIPGLIFYDYTMFTGSSKWLVPLVWMLDMTSKFLFAIPFINVLINYLYITVR